jgi:DNA-binding beta-propeller fold protein YncE
MKRLSFFMIIVGMIVYSSGCATTSTNTSTILGAKPSRARGIVGWIPNKQAIGTRIWVPGFDEGYVPQGLTFAEEQILVSFYRSTDVKISTGTSRVYRIDPKTGIVTGQFDLPLDVGHPGGLAYAGNDALYVANLGTIYKLDLKKAIEDGNCERAVISQVFVDKSMGPSFITYDGRHLWFGKYSRSSKPKIFKVDSDRPYPENHIHPDSVLFSFNIDTRSQGATFDKDGYLWLSQSGSKWGKLQKVDSSNGKVLKEYKLMAGLEDLSFSPDGKLWSVSEAGTLRWFNWDTSYPLIFEIDTKKLK